MCGDRQEPRGPRQDSQFGNAERHQLFLDFAPLSSYGFRSLHMSRLAASKSDGFWKRLVAQIGSLREKRARVIDAFLDGAIHREERNSRLAIINRDSQSAQDLLARTNPAALVDLDLLIEAFAPLLEWEYWSRDQKRSVLATIVPDIRVADYQVTELGLHPSVFSKENTRTDRDSWRRPA
jgi:hypothetical protein